MTKKTVFYNGVSVPNINTPEPKYICKKSSIPFDFNNLDGKLDKPFWEQAKWICDFNDIEGIDFPKPLKNTRVKVLWDDYGLYFGAYLEENEIWATVENKDDTIFVDNDFEIFLTPASDPNLYYEFEMNAKNTQWDLLLHKAYRDFGKPIISWDIKNLQSAVHIDGVLNSPKHSLDGTNKGWSLEVIFPWRTLLEKVDHNGLGIKQGDIWRLNFSRVEWQVEIKDCCENNESNDCECKNKEKFVKKIDPKTGKNYPEYNWVWSPTGVIDIHLPEKWGYLVFSDTNGKNYQIPNSIKAEKWIYKIYYLERNFGAKYGYYETDLNKLFLAFDKKFSKEWLYEFEPTIFATENLFEISLPVIEKDNTKKTVHLTTDGFLFTKNKSN